MLRYSKVHRHPRVIIAIILLVIMAIMLIVIIAILSIVIIAILLIPPPPLGGARPRGRLLDGLGVSAPARMMYSKCCTIILEVLNFRLYVKCYIVLLYCIVSFYSTIIARRARRLCSGPRIIIIVIDDNSSNDSSNNGSNHNCSSSSSSSSSNDTYNDEAPKTGALNKSL